MDAGGFATALESRCVRLEDCPMGAAWLCKSPGLQNCGLHRLQGRRPSLWEMRWECRYYEAEKLLREGKRRPGSPYLPRGPSHQGRTCLGTGR